MAPQGMKVGLGDARAVRFRPLPHPAPTGAHIPTPLQVVVTSGAFSYQFAMPVAAATTAHENVACRLGVVDFERTHLRARTWVPGFPGTTGMGLSGLFAEEFSMPVSTGTTARENASW